MQHVLTYLTRVEGFVAAVAYTVVALAVLSDVVLREFFSISHVETPKAALFASITAGLIGIGIATANGSHLRPKFTDNWLPLPLHAHAARIGDAFSAMVFAAAGWISIGLVTVAYDLNFLVPALDWPLWPFQMLMPYAFFSSALRHLFFAINPALKPAEVSFE